MAYGVQYSWVVTLLKGLVAGGGTTGVSAIVQWVLDGTTTGDWSMKPETQGIVISLISGAAAALWVMFKNVAKQKWGWVLPVLLCAVALQGCATWSPAVGGKTEIETTFSDVLGPDGSQNTQYKQILHAPAGVEAKDLASMSYQWQPDGSGAIAVSSSPNANTVQQGPLLEKAMASDDARLNFLIQGLAQLSGIWSPVVGQGLMNDAANDQAKAVNRAALQSLIADIVKQAIAAQPKPAQPPADSPGADLPEVGTN